MIKVDKNEFRFSGNPIDLMMELCMVMRNFLEDEVCCPKELHMLADLAAMNEKEVHERAEALKKEIFEDEEAEELFENLFRDLFEGE